MSADFLAASSQRLVNTAPVFTAVPFSVGFWARPTTTGTARVMWCLADTAGGNNSFFIRQDVGNTFTLTSKAGGALQQATGGTVTASSWYYFVVRCVSATNRHAAILNPDGTMTALANTTSSVPAGLDTMALGALTENVVGSFFSGQIGRFWYTNTDIQADGAALQEATLRQLAYGGPFSVPHIVPDLVEYRALTVGLASNSDQLDDDYSGRNGRQTWTNVGSVTTGQEPPLPGWHQGPSDRYGILAV